MQRTVKRLVKPSALLDGVMILLRTAVHTRFVFDRIGTWLIFVTVDSNCFVKHWVCLTNKVTRTWEVPPSLSPCRRTNPHRSLVRIGHVEGGSHIGSSCLVQPMSGSGDCAESACIVAFVRQCMNIVSHSCGKNMNIASYE